MAGMLQVALWMSASLHAAPADAVFANGFEPPCAGTPNDLAGCVFVPFGQAPSPATLDAAETARWERLDVYLLLDRSASMSTELNSIRNNAGTVYSGLACPPIGNGVAGACFPSLWGGAGQFAYADSGADAYRNVLDVQAFPLFGSLVATSPAGTTQEATLLALHSAITGQGGSSCTVASVAPRTNCAADRSGYPCFRLDASQLVVLFSDEAPSANFTCPDWATLVRPEYMARGARVGSVYGSGASAQAIGEFSAFATGTGAVAGGGAPLVFSGADANASVALQALLETFRDETPMNVHVELVDDPSDAVDTTTFVDHFEVVNDGSEGCPASAPAADTDAHPGDDTFVAVAPGGSVCFRIVVAANASVPAGATAGFYPADLVIIGDVGMTIASYPLVFTIPADP